MNTPQNDIKRPPGGTGGHRAGGSGSGTGQAADEAARLARQAKEEGKARIDDYRGTAADKVDQLRQGVKAAASELDHGGGLGDLSGHIDDLAGGMARLSQGLREKSADELVRDASRLARNNPAVFLAGGVALGFTLTRLLRASRQAADGHQDDEPHDGTERASRGVGVGTGVPGEFSRGGHGPTAAPLAGRTSAASGAGAADPFAAGNVTAGSAAGRDAPGSSTLGGPTPAGSTPAGSPPGATTATSRPPGRGGYSDNHSESDTGRTP